MDPGAPPKPTGDTNSTSPRTEANEPAKLSPRGHKGALRGSSSGEKSPTPAAAGRAFPARPLGRGRGRGFATRDARAMSTTADFDLDDDDGGEPVSPRNASTTAAVAAAAAVPQTAPAARTPPPAVLPPMVSAVAPIQQRNRSAPLMGDEVPPAMPSPRTGGSPRNVAAGVAADGSSAALVSPIRPSRTGSAGEPPLPFQRARGTADSVSRRSVTEKDRDALVMGRKSIGDAQGSPVPIPVFSSAPATPVASTASPSVWPAGGGAAAAVAAANSDATDLISSADSVEPGVNSLTRSRNAPVQEYNTLDPSEYKPLVGLKNKPRRNSMAGIFSGDPVLRMVQLLGEYPFFVEQLSLKIDSSDAQRLVDAIINVSVPFGRTLFLTKAMIDMEFENNKTQPSSILRGNCVTSKLMGSFGHFSGQKYLFRVLHASVWWIVCEKERLSFEVDPAKETRADVRARNRVALVDATRKTLADIINPTVPVPPEICSLAKFTADAAKKYCPDQLQQLVGGYVMLRLVNPSLVAPEAYRIIPANQTPSPHARRNLTLISKLLQNISNGSNSSSKEPYMADFSDFVAEQSQLFFKFLDRLVEAGVDSSVTRTIPADEADVGFIEGKHLAFLHKHLSSKSDELSRTLSALPRKTLGELEMFNIVKLVTSDQEPPRNKNVPTLPWLCKHYRSGMLMKEGDKKRKKHKKAMRFELTRYWLLVVDPTLPLTQSVTNSAQVIKAYPLDGVEVSLKAIKKDTVMEVVCAQKTMVFINRDGCDPVDSWHRAITAVKADAARAKPQSGNERFQDRPSRGAVSDVLTAFQGSPRLPYSVTLTGRFAGRPGAKGPVDVKCVVRVQAFGTSWDLEVSLYQITVLLTLLQKELEGVIVTPLPRVFSRPRLGNAPDAKDFSVALGDDGAPSRGCQVFRDWLASFLLEVQSSFEASHSRPVLYLLELSSPFRAASNVSLAHLRWIHRFKLGLATKDRRGANVLMVLCSDPRSNSAEHTDIVKFLVDSRAISLKDVDAEGLSVLHRVVLAGLMDRGVMLCELGLEHVPNKSGQLPLHLAAELGSAWVEFIEACVEQALASGNVNAVLGVDEKGRTPLAYAIAAGHADVADTLVDAAEALVEAQHVTKPVAALCGGKGVASCVVLALGANMSALAKRLIESELVAADAAACVAAASSGNAEVFAALRVLIKDMATFVDDKGRTMLHAASVGGNVDCIESCLEAKCDVAAVDSARMTPLMCASQAGQAGAVAALLRAGAAAGINVADAQQATALHYGAMGQRVEVVKQLIAAGAVEKLDGNRRTPLYAAIERGGSLDVVNYLLETGSSPNVSASNGLPLLHLAVLKGNADVLKALLECSKSKCDTGAVDKTGSTALHAAVVAGSAPMCQMLLAHGAASDAVNGSGETPLIVAAKAKRRDIVMLFN